MHHVLNVYERVGAELQGMLYMLQHTLCFRREVEYIYVFVKKKIPHLRDQGISEARAGRQAGRLASASKRPSGPRGHGPCGQLRQIRRWTVDGSRQRRSERLDFDRLESSRVRRAAPCRRALRQSPRLTPTPILRPSVASHQPPAARPCVFSSD